LLLLVDEDQTMPKLVIALFLCGVVGVGCRPHPEEFVATPCTGPLPVQERVAAMLSVRAHAYAAVGQLPAGETPQTLGLPPIRNAARTLLGDCDPLAPSRRRRAAALLAAYGGDTAGPDIAWAWRKLLDDDPQLISRVETILANAPGEHLKVPEIEASVFETLGDMTRPLDCTEKDAVFSGPNLDPNGGFVAWEISLTVQKPSSWVAARLDPQTWSSCSSFFPNSFYTSDRPPHVSSCTAPGSTPSNNNGQTVGTPYHATLFEHFQCAACQSELQNLLGITTVSQSSGCFSGSNPCDPMIGLQPNPAFQVCYRLAPLGAACGNPPAGALSCSRDALYACAGSPAEHEDLIQDWGDLSACTPTTGTGLLRVVSRKNVKFANPFSNVGTWTLFWLGKQEETDSLVEMVCCLTP
jgi:hypothetical protein